mgnify:CR=1 FL=1
MKVLFSFVYPLEGDNGGVERVTTSIIKGLEKRGVECYYLLCEDCYRNLSIDGRQIMSLDDYLVRNHIDVIVNQDGACAGLTRLLQHSKWSGKYVVCFHNTLHMFDRMYSFSVVYKCLRKQKSIIWFLRLLFLPLWRRSVRKGTMREFRINYDNADRFVLLSRSFFNEFKQLTKVIECNKLCAISNVLTMPIAASYSQDGKKKVVLTVCRLHKEKRVNYMLKAWVRVEEKHPDWHFNILGDGPMLNSLKEQCRQLNLKNVTFFGKQPPLEYYSEASIFLMCSDYEGWGLTLTEAQAQGCVPIVMDSYSSLHDIVTNNENGLIIPNNDLDAFGNAINKLIETPDKLRMLAHKGRESIRSFSEDVIIDKWIKIFE